MGKKKGGAKKDRATYEKTPASAIPDYKPSRNLMPRVSKEAKVSASFASTRGVCKRTAILSMGEAEENFKKNGRLVLAKG